ncbi:myoD family inhibitor domain-containing protein 2 [Austrofundulus limnaeus]|uniref:MyoD family inhibitor domain-containing protein 2 n=1 Tax=Austrofundulus limnaeus TaxID=52670 RepID=A0A2I4BAX8_AUSLI|nr:PREDICTED: myoD family inhibitor-like [Austrofundulus limnaeus]
MDQMADETTLRADEKDKRKAHTRPDNAAWVRGEKCQSDEVNSWRVSAENERGESSRGTDFNQPRKKNNSPPRLFSLNKKQMRYSAAVSNNTDDLSASQQSNMAVDCADIVLNCLFCRLYGILPDSCERLTNHCWPNYKHVVTTVESTHSEDDDSCVELDCGFFGSCHDASDCLELAMEVSEICFH